MSFDALTIAGIFSAALAGGFLLLLGYRKDAVPTDHREPSHSEIRE